MYLYLNPLQFNVTVNGMTRTVDRGTTLNDMIAEASSPAAGQSARRRREVLEEGGGAAFAGTVNGNEVTDGATELHKGDVVQLDDGADATEDYDVSTEETVPGQVELGEGAIHVYVPGEPAQVETRTGKVSGKSVQETVKEGSDNVYLKYNANTNGEKVIALTFDDGPWPTTQELLDVLKENDAVATFFTIGEQISDKTDYVETIKRMAAEGHQIGTHSDDHAATGGNGVDMTRQSPEKQIEEVQMGQQAIADATGKEASRCSLAGRQLPRRDHLELAALHHGRDRLERGHRGLAATGRRRHCGAPAVGKVGGCRAHARRRRRSQPDHRGAEDRPAAA
ncbi:MAG: polysaccharide deacetylase family protein [Adlercreutzia equolifaciens]